MPTTLLLPDGYNHVLASVVAASSLAFVHHVHVAIMRRAAGVPYPNAYATAEEAQADAKKYRFNAAHRAQANYGDTFPAMAVSMLVAGLRYPRAASTLGLVWTASRVLMLYGYSSASASAKDKGSGRRLGSWGALVFWGTLGLAGWTSWGLVQ